VSKQSNVFLAWYIDLKSNQDAPKYDEKLRVEYEVEITSRNTFRLYATKVSKRNVHEYLGEFKSYKEAREFMFTKFYNDFNRPSEYSIRYAGASPLQKIWDYTKDGRQVKNSISIVEGSKTVRVVEYKPKVITLKIRKEAPLAITVSSLYPKYFEKKRERHERRLQRLRRMKRRGGIGRRFK
jgi:hypothetical protein